jgi:hypothetical protein
VPRNASIEDDQIKALCQFFDETVATLKTLRAQARARNQIPPPYPTTLDEVRRLLVQLRRNAKAVN